MLALIVLMVAIDTSLLAWMLFSGVLGLLGSGSTKNKVLQRLQTQFDKEKVKQIAVDKDAEDEGFTRMKIFMESFTTRFLRLPIVVNILLTPSNLKKTEEKLVWAGHPFNFTADQWISANIFLTVIIGLYAFMMYVLGNIELPILVLYIIGILVLPNWWLNNRIKARQDVMMKELPNIINKLVLATMSQAQMLNALNIVVKHTSGILTEEIRTTLSAIRINAGELSAEQAFWDMAKRCGNPQVTSFCTSVINSILVKASIKSILEEQANNMKEVRKARNEEVINKTDTYLMVSAALGVMAIIVLAIGPGFVMIMQGLGGK